MPILGINNYNNSMNNFKYTLDNKRYHTFNYYLKNKYKCKVSKVIIDAHLTCPNIDGSKGFGGCTYCSIKGSGDSNIYSNKSIMEQYENNKKIMDKKWPSDLYIPYFQSHSNTYTNLNHLKEMLEPFINNKEVAEISLATRCDCLNDDIVNYLNNICNKKQIWLELGLQTSNDNTEKYLNRCYLFKDFINAINKLSKTNIKICVHIIDGLPFEEEKDMLQTIKDINNLPIHAIKIHMLHIIEGSKMEKIFKENNLKLLSREKYIEIVVKQLELLKEEIIVERLTSDPIIDNLVEPLWLTNKTTILNDIDKLMVKKNTYQGKNI